MLPQTAAQSAGSETTLPSPPATAPATRCRRRTSIRGRPDETVHQTPFWADRLRRGLAPAPLTPLSQCICPALLRTPASESPAPRRDINGGCRRQTPASIRTAAPGPDAGNREARRRYPPAVTTGASRRPVPPPTDTTLDPARLYTAAHRQRPRERPGGAVPRQWAPPVGRRRAENTTDSHKFRAPCKSA